MLMGCHLVRLYWWPVSVDIMTFLLSPLLTNVISSLYAFVRPKASHKWEGLEVKR